MLLNLEYHALRNQNEYVIAAVEAFSVTKVYTSLVVDVCIAVVTNEVKSEAVQLTGFRLFEIAKRVARTGRNHATDKKIKSKTLNTFKFKAGAFLKKR